MIGMLTGKLIESNQETCLLDVNGVGYEISMSALSLNEIEFKLTKEIRLWIYTHVREDAFQLFGFLTKSERALFVSLLKVNGIGPRKAIEILSGTSPKNLIELVDNGDARGLSQLPKVGKKTAEQIILTLKGKLVSSEQKGGLENKQSQVVSALLNLGFKSGQVEQFVSTLPKDIEIEEGIRKGLQALSSSL